MRDYFYELDGPQSYMEGGRRILCKGGGETTTVQKSDPPAYLAPYLKYNANNAYKATQTGAPVYGGERFAPLNAQQEQGLNMTEQRALAGSPVMNAANANLQSTLNGDFLNADSNPYLKSTVDHALGDVQSRVNSQFGGSNFGGTAHQEWLGRNLAEASLPIYNQNYQQERGRQMQANLFAPQAAQSDYQDLQALLGVGDVRQAQEQQGLDYNFDQWLQQQKDPYEKMTWLSQILNGSPGGQTTATGPDPYQQNKTASALGGAAGGAALGSMVAGASNGAIGGPWGMGIGAGIGLLGGLLG